jgi:predicted nucleic acid-binding Zn ribbon protein
VTSARTPAGAGFDGVLEQLGAGRCYAVLAHAAPGGVETRTVGVTEVRARSARCSVGRSRLTVPVYVYRRLDGSTFEIEQRITEASLVSCPTTGQTVGRVLQPFTPRYRGTGFYSTDHRKPKAKEQPKGDGGT